MPSSLLPHLPDGIRRLVAPVRADLAPALLQAVESLCNETPPGALAIDATAQAVSSHRVPVYETASYILGDLAVYDSRAMAALIELSRSSDARVRHNALLCLTEEMPNEVTVEVINRALGDRSSRVRRKAADWAGRLRLSAVLPVLKAALATEQHEETRDVMAFEVERLQSGPT